MKEIQLTQGKVALVDDKDYEWLMQWKWCYARGYAVRKSSKANGGNLVLMHREIINAPSNIQVDHVNQNKSDNRRENLRLATHAQNQHNRPPTPNRSSQYKGVHWVKREKRWYAKIKHGRKEVCIGYFRDEIEAAKAYDQKAKELFGEFAYLNFPQ